MLSRYSIHGGRRVGVRRAGEAREVYVDRFPASAAFLLIGIFLLNVLDAVFTLLHLQDGGQELNPIVARVLAWGPQTFFFVKCGVTFACLLFLLLHARYRLVQRIFAVVFGVYFLVLVYHLYLNSL